MMRSIPDEYVPFVASRPTPDRPDTGAPRLIDTLGAAGTAANWPYRTWRYLQARDGSTFDPEHNPFDLIKGTKYASDPERFAHARDAQETRAIMAEWDADEEASGTLARAGTMGTVAAVGMGMLDPTIFIPVIPAVSGIRSGATALKVGADVALTAGLTAAVGETAMAVTTPGYDGGDAAFGIGTATILGGLIGTGAGALLSRAERNAAIASLDKLRTEWGQEATASTMPAPGGAAVSDTRKLDLNTPKLLQGLPDVTAKLSPPRRVLNSPFLSARRTVVDLVEQPYIFRDNAEGVATTQGPALDRLAKLETGKARVALERQFDSAYSRYRFDSVADTKLEKAARFLTRAKEDAGYNGSGKANFTAFRAMVDDALRNNDQHDITEVAETARMIRSTVLAPWRDRAIKAGLLPEGIDAKTADSYMMRVWNKQALIRQRPKAVQVIADWLDGQEAEKARLQQVLTNLAGELETVNGKIAKLESATVKKLGHDAELIDLNSARDGLRGRIEDAVNAWDGKSAKAAQAAINRRPEAKGEKRLTAADADVDAAVARMLAKPRRTDRKDTVALADEIIDRILGTPDGRLPYDAPTARGDGFGAGNADARGPLAARSFMIPDALVREFIETDALSTAQLYLQTMVPDVLLTERFGDVRMTMPLKAVQDEAAALSRTAKNESERAAIHAQRDNVMADMASMRDRVRHTYGWSSDPRQRFMGRMAVTASRYDLMTNLGGATLSSLSDLAGIQWRYGMTSAFRGAWLPFFKALMSPKARDALRADKRQLQSLGIAAETYLNSRTSGIADVIDVYKPGSRFERGMAVAADKFGIANFLAVWTDFGKLGAGMVSAGELTRAAKAVSSGKASARQVRDLAENGIDAAMAARINAMLDSAGGADVIEGTVIPNTGAWKDVGARDAFEGAMARDVDLMIITPGAEKPLMMSKPVAALILQYKSFIAAANERLMVRSLQARDAQVLQGMVSAIGLGVLAEYCYSIATDRAGPKTMPDMIKAGITRSGVFGWYAEANALSSKWTGGTADAFRLIGTERPDARYITRSRLGALLGPTSGKIEALLSVASDAANLTWNGQDTERLRRFMIGQNLFYIRRLLDTLTDEVNEAFGVEPIDRNKPNQ